MAARALGAVALGALALAGLWLPLTAAADTVIATELAPAKVSSDTNRVVWSSYDPATGDFHLMSREATGALTRLPVAPRKVPFDVDLGYLGEGLEAAVYSRCATEPALIGGAPELLPSWATGRGCDVYQLDFQTGRELRRTDVSTRGGSEFLPTVGPSHRIAFARVYERRRGQRGRLPYLYAKRGRHRARRLAGGPRGKTGLPGPTSLDIFGKRLAFAWDYATKARGFRGSEVRLDRIPGRHRLIDSALTGLTVRELLSPVVTPTVVGYGRVVQNDGDSSEYRSYSISRRTRKTAPAPKYLVSTSFDPVSGTAVSLTSQTISAASPSPGQPPSCTPPASPPPSPRTASCVVARSDPISFAR